MLLSPRTVAVSAIAVTARMKGRLPVRFLPSLTLPTLLLLGLAPTLTQGARRPPHLVVVVADDLGWSDVGYRDPEMVTPHIDRLAREGVTLNYSYMQQVCSPSRAAFFSGYYPFRMGLQNSVFTALSNQSMPLHYRLLPQDLQKLGYSTHYVGKWHLGFCRPEMTPTYRGFDTFYGMYTGKADYFTHRSKWDGYDLQDNKGKGHSRNFTADWAGDGTYSTDLFTDRAVDLVNAHDQTKPLFLFLSYQAVHGPLQVPRRYVNETCAHVTSGGRDRKLHCAMTAAMDEGVGKVMAALEARGFSDNLITLFISDNGGPIKLASSNWPLRGSKITLWEGGTRAVTILHSKRHLPAAPYTWNGLMHAVDWYPTLMRAAGYRSRIRGIDGVENWRRLVKNNGSRRKEFVYNIDDVKDNAALRFRQYKLVNNKPGSPDGWYHPPAGVVNNRTVAKGKYPEYMLFDLDKDPEETTDISQERKYQNLVGRLKTKLDNYKAQLLPTTPAQKVEAGKPKYHNGAWTTGWC